MLVQWSLVWLFVCFLANCYYILNLCVEYLKYDVTTNEQHIIPESIELASVTFCFAIPRSVNWRQLSLEGWNRALFSGLRDSEFEKITAEERINLLNSKEKLALFLSYQASVSQSLKYGNISAGELFNITVSLEEILDEIIFLGQNRISNKTLQLTPYTIQQLPVIAEATEFISYNSKCFTVEIKDNRFRNFNYRLLKRYKRLNGILQIIVFQDTQIPFLLGDVEIYFHKYGHKYNNEQESGIVSLSTPGTIYRITFDTHHTSLLGSPYTTNCMFYGINKTQEHCFQNCVKEGSSSLLNRIPSTVSLYKFEPYKFLTRREEDGGEIFTNTSLTFSKIETLCNKRCPKRECQTSVFIPRVSSS